MGPLSWLFGRWMHVLLGLVEVADSENGDGLGADGAPLFRI